MRHLGHRHHRENPHSQSDAASDAGASVALGEVDPYARDDQRAANAVSQLRVLQQLSALAPHASAAEICKRATNILAREELSVAIMYLLDEAGSHVQLAGVAGLDPKLHVPDNIALAPEMSSGWPFGAAARTGARVDIPDLTSHLIASETLDKAIPPLAGACVPVPRPGSALPYGFLLAGTDALAIESNSIHVFLQLAAAQIGSAITHSRALRDAQRRETERTEFGPATTGPLTNITHELRAPLTMRIGPLEHLSRIDAGRIQVAYEPANFSLLTSDIAHRFQPAFARAGLELQLDCPPLAGPVYLDREMWEQIVCNLLSNAIKFTLAGKVLVSVRSEGNHAVLRVRDTGIGIPAADLPQLFQRIRRCAGGAARTTEGACMGLSLVNELVKFHRGELAVTSDVNVGSTFSVRIPLGLAHLPSERIRAQRASGSMTLGAEPYVQEALRWLPESAQATSLQTPAARADTPLDRRFAATFGCRIVLADHDAEMRSYLHGFLSPHYEVECVADGAQVLAAAQRQRPDLILAEAMMPRTDGHALIKRIRRDESLRNVPIILVSVRTGEDAMLAGLDAGADDYIVKPFSPRELLTRVGSALELSRIRTSSADRLRLGLEAARMSAWDWNLDTMEATFPGSTQEARGGAWIGIHAHDAVVHPDDLAGHRAATELAIAQLGELKSEVRVRGEGDSHWRWIEIRAQIYADSAGRACRASGVTLDITERKHSEIRRAFLLNFGDRMQGLADPVEIIATATQLLAAHLNLGRVFYCEVEPDGEYCRIENDWTRASLHSLVGRHRMEDFGVEVAHQMRSGQIVRVDDIHTDERMTGVRATYDAIGVRATLAMPLMKRGRVVAALIGHDANPRLWDEEDVLLMREATERTWESLARARVQVALRESESRFSALADGVPLPIWVLDKDGEVQFVNRAFCEYFGKRQHEIEGKRGWYSLIHPDDGSFIDEVKAALAERRALWTTGRVRRADGEWRWIEAHAVPRYEADGSFVGLSGMSPDVTEQRELENQREQMLEAERAARMAAESATRLKDDFLASLSHELRTPLSVIVAWSRMLQRKFGDRDQQLREGLGILSDSALTQSNLISDLLDMSRIVSGKLTLDIEPIDLHGVLVNAVSSQRPAAEAKGISLQLRNDAYLGLVLADETRLKQVFWNLLSNAIKFTPNGGAIEVAVRKFEQRFTITVHDNGEGIAAQFLPHIFERFSQADGSSTRRHGGLGLGLAIVKQLVEMHGGIIEASSAGPMQGSTFTISLPAHQPGEGLGRRARPELRETESLSGCRVLAVEDQPHMLEYLKRVLEEQGADVSAVGSAQAAIDALRRHDDAPYQILVTDIGMPGIDGYQLLRTIREELALSAESLPAVAVTAFAREEDRRRALDSGFQAHLSKPLQIGQLVALIKSAKTMH